MLPLRARVDQGAMAMKGYFAFPKALTLLEPHNQVAKCHIRGTHWVGVGLTPLQRCNLCIVKPQLIRVWNLIRRCESIKKFEKPCFKQGLLGETILRNNSGGQKWFTFKKHLQQHIYYLWAMVIVVGNGHGDPSAFHEPNNSHSTYE